MHLTKFSRYQKDKDLFLEVLGKITNPTLKKEMEKSYDLFCKQTQLIESAHNSTYGGYIRPQSVKENVDIMVAIRRKLYKVAKDLDRT